MTLSEIEYEDRLEQKESFIAKQQERVAALEAENKCLREGLKNVEWIDKITDGETGNVFHSCPACMTIRNRLHKPDCWLNALLESK